MLQLFRNDYFRYNGKDSSEICNLVLCEVGNGDITEIQNGLSRQTENADKNGYVSVTNNTIKFEIGLIKMDDKGLNPLGFTDDELFEINRWLLGGTRKYKPLEQDGYVYYAIFTSGTKWFNNYDKKTGYLKYEVEMLPYCYSPFIEQTVKLSDKDLEKEIQLYNNSNVEENDIGLNLDVSLLDDGDYLKIENLTNGTIMEFVDMTEDECKKFQIIGEDLFGNKIHILKSLIDEDYNLMRHTYVRKWLNLYYGMNNLKITSNGAVTVKIKYRNKIQIM